MKLFTCLPIIILLCGETTAAINIPKNFDFTNFIETIPKAISIFKNLKNLWHDLLEDPDINISSALFRSREEKILGNFLEVSTRLSSMEREVGVIAETTIATILGAIPKIIKLELNLHELTIILNQIKFAEEQMRNYLIHGYKNRTTETKEIEFTSEMEFARLSNPKSNQTAALEDIMSNSIMKRQRRDRDWIVEEFTLVDFAQWAAGHSFNSLISLLNRLNDLVSDPESNLFHEFRTVSEEMKANTCNFRQSPFQVLYNLYNAIAVAELKGNTILQFSYMILKMYNKGNFSVEANLAFQVYKKNSKEKLHTIREALSHADRTVYKCDPLQHVEGVSYTKLTKLLQAYIENEVNLNPYGTCRENCQYYQFTEYNGCYMAQFCAHQPKCSGKVISCRYVDSDMDICTSSNPERRYEWVHYENGKTLGSKGACERKNLFKVDSWWRYLFWHCSYCLCLCDDSNQNSDRYFNLRDVTSDVEKNKVVTGVRIVKQNQIIHFQIQQGTLTPLGVVNKTSLSWKPVDNYRIDDDNVENNVDYHTMSWLSRAIDTDEVFGPSEHVVTGVRFRKIGTHLNLEIRVTPINFTSGTVFPSQHSYWLGNDNTDASQNNPRTEIVLSDPDIPIRNGPHILNSKHDQFIQFHATSMDKDAGQSTVPYLDSQALTSQGFILSGIGLIHRGKSGSGGFIAPKLISYDFLPHLLYKKTD